MRKYIALVLALVCLWGLFGCSTGNPDASKPVFEMDNIRNIILIEHTNIDKEYEVPSQYVDDITTWLGSFHIGKVVSDEVSEPGSNSVSVRIAYTDGTVVENGLSTVMVDGTEYYMSSTEAPDCYMEILSEPDTED